MIAVSLALALQAPTLTPPVDAGSKVSVTTSTAPGRVVGRFQGVDSTHVTLGVGEQSAISIPLRSVSGVRMSLGKDRRKGARRGALVGLGLGTWFVIDEYRGVAENDYWGVGRIMLLGVGVLSTGLGAGIGSTIPPEGWEPVDISSPTTTSAQSANVVLSFHPEERVRVRTRERKYTGSVSAITETSLTIAAPEATRIAWSDVTELKVRGGRNRKRGALLGAAALIAVGIRGETTSGATTSTSERIGAFTGAALVGAILGSRLLGGRGWVSLPLPAR